MRHTRRDVVIDRVYIIGSNQSGGTTIGEPMPEPATAALLLAAFAGALTLRRRRRPD
ncbi:MAG: PEP-CTERM sorting domain-containing protein [Burkholderiales bacterium]|nr:PEP-CTERM sorting domain-containing protein [Burkholderiales bacterium]